jgi:hypothetical protein
VLDFALVNPEPLAQRHESRTGAGGSLLGGEQTVSKRLPLLRGRIDESVGQWRTLLMRAAVENFNKVERLVPSRTAPIDAISTYTAGEAHAALIEQWALAGGEGDPPPNPHTAEIQSLQDDLRTAGTRRAAAAAQRCRAQESGRR